MSKETYIIWSDGVITSMAKKAETQPDNGDISVLDPVNIIFTIAQDEIPGQGDVAPEERKYRPVLRFDIQPYIFGALLTGGKNVWTIKQPKYTLDNTELESALIDAYNERVSITSKRSTPPVVTKVAEG